MRCLAWAASKVHLEASPKRTAANLNRVRFTVHVHRESQENRSASENRNRILSAKEQPHSRKCKHQKMGQKVHPLGFRLVLNRNWSSRWFATGRKYTDFLEEDLKLQAHLKKNLRHAGISRIEIERPEQKIRVTLFVSRPGIVIGRKGGGVDALRAELAQMAGCEMTLNIRETKHPEANAQLIAENIAGQLQRRAAFRRTIRRSLTSAMRLGIAGCKIMVSGRLNGAEMSRREWVHEGRVPLHTLRADLEYGAAEAHTTFGLIGVKTWIYKGENFHARPHPRRSRGGEGDSGRPGSRGRPS